MGLDRVDILLKTPRYICPMCNSSITRQLDSTEEGRQMTKRLCRQIKHDAFVEPFNKIAAEYGYSDTEIAGFFDEYALELEHERGQVIAPRVLGIDEKHIVHEQRGVFVDIETGILLDMTKDNKRDTIIEKIIKSPFKFDEIKNYFSSTSALSASPAALCSSYRAT